MGELPYNATYYWRVRGSDGTNRVAVLERAVVHDARSRPPRRRRPAEAAAYLAGVPTGTGGRTPDPTGGRLPLPAYGANIVTAVAKANPGALQNSCQEHGGSWQFMDQVVDTLRTYDTRWGYNGKRGNANDPSNDVITYHYGPGPDANSTDVYIIDIIGGHCGATPSPTWIDVTDVTVQSGTVGRWISRGRF